MVRIKLLPQHLKQLVHALQLSVQVQPAQQALEAGGRAVLLRGGVFGHTGLAGVATPLEDSQLVLGEKRLQQLLFPELRPGRDVFDLFGVELSRRQTVVLHQPLPHQKFQYTVAHEGQCQRAQLPGVDLFGFVHRTVFPFISVLALSVIAAQCHLSQRERQKPDRCVPALPLGELPNLVRLRGQAR